MLGDILKQELLVGLLGDSMPISHSDILLLFLSRTLSKAAAYSSRSKRVCSDKVDVRDVWEDMDVWEEVRWREKL